MNGISIEERGARFRVLRSFASGSVVTLGTFTSAGAAVAYATEQVLALEDSPEIAGNGVASTRR